ncbi:hypothetical protein E2C01_026014 [Portunus trituberculatus]|uniref:Uncharacterized protein n=1 Tax=Portunus trituberculatus TaxID=210409 RepID=A0A5B7EEE1_PORTR|nr:hypothetical protein [Portunus trituberculatus]
MDEPRDVVKDTAEGPAAGGRGDDGDGKQLAVGPGRDDVAQQNGKSGSKKDRPIQKGLDARGTSAQGKRGERMLLPATSQQLVQAQREDSEMKTLLQEAPMKEEATINYLISTPDRKKSTRSVHVNLLAALAAIGVDTEDA